MNGVGPIRRGGPTSHPAPPIPGDEPDRVRTLVTSALGTRWPEGLSPDRELDRRVGFELSRTSVRKELDRRFAGRLDGRRAASRLRLPQLAAYMGAGFLTYLVTGNWVIAMVGAFAGRLPIFLLAMRRSAQTFDDPQFRAGLRREGVDCCVDCGQLMGGGTDAGTCPECGRPHADFPLGWGPPPWKPRKPWRSPAPYASRKS